ncbi:GyrI-like domain-containing protein [Lentzea albida]|uniref:Effector-binding domain-containing protein n=1 Tax=Lentzea albida TaxID=65499 RepID=A0A1H9RAR3_9PSEU|nr:GyrI-like domain-containing protein [Lentzea albida]SER69780.1 effector-binding domain-containing protein [Lentzea albida]
MTYDVTLTELASTTTCHQRVHTTAAGIAGAVGRGLQELYEFAADCSATPTGPPQLALAGPLTDGDVTLDLYLPISATPAARGPIDVVVLPEGPAAQTFHHGRYEDIPAAYEAVFAWIREHGRHQAGPPRELYLTGPDTATNPADYLTEVVVPLRRD